MSIINTEKGYLIQDSKGTIHAQNIPDIKLARFYLKQITIARKGLK